MIQKNILSILALVLGLIILVVNVMGLFIPLKNPDIYNEPKTGFENDTNISYKETIKQLESISRQDTKEYVKRINDIINRSIAHYWEEEGVSKYNIIIPPNENYILYALSFIYSDYKKYEFCNYKKAVERGIGMCSQHAIAITDFLNKKGIKTRVVGLDGHIVATANVDEKNNEWWVLDPDIGTVIPYSMEEIESSPDIVRPYYENKLGKNLGLSEEHMAKLYDKEGNVVFPLGNFGYMDCNWKKVFIERFSYFLIWVIPVLLFFPYIILKFYKSKKDE